MVRNFTLSMFDSKSPVIVFRSVGYEGIIKHRHEFIEIIYILSGNGIHSINGESIPIKKDDLFVISTGDIHSIIPNDDVNTFEWMNCVISYDLLDAKDINISPNEIVDSSSNSYIKSILLDMEQEFKDKSFFYIDYLKGAAISLISKIKRQSLLLNKQTVAKTDNVKNDYLASAILYIKMNYNKKIYIGDIASNIGISVGYLERLFRDERATSPMEYLNIYRIEKACGYLMSTDLSIKQICFDVGFSDLKNFYQTFKHQTNVSPGEFRSIHKAG